MKISDYIKNKTMMWGIALIVVGTFLLGLNHSLITRSNLNEYKNLDGKIEKFNEVVSRYDSENYDEISEYLDLRVEFEAVQQEFQEYKEKYPDSLVEDIEKAKKEVNESYAKAVEMENKWKEEKAAKAAQQAKEESTVTSSSSSSSNSSSSTSSSGGSSHNHTANDKHIGKGVYVSNGNSYYHAISNCKYLEGAKTSYVTLTSSMRKYECNCWTNPVTYKKPSSSSSSSSSSSGGRTVYIASGNSYYHNSSSCKFLSGASAKAVGINNVGGKHACNCVKY